MEKFVKIHQSYYEGSFETIYTEIFFFENLNVVVQVESNKRYNSYGGTEEARTMAINILKEDYEKRRRSL